MVQWQNAMHKELHCCVDPISALGYVPDCLYDFQSICLAVCTVISPALYHLNKHGLSLVGSGTSC